MNDKWARKAQCQYLHQSLFRDVLPTYTHNMHGIFTSLTKALTPGLLAATLGILLDQLQELVHALRLDVGLDDDADGLPGGHGGVAIARGEGAGCVRACAGSSSGAGQKGTGRSGGGCKDGGDEEGAGEHVSHGWENAGTKVGDDASSLARSFVLGVREV